MIDTQSPRIHGLGRDARVFDVTCSTDYARIPGIKPHKHAEVLKQLNQKKTDLQLARDACKHEIDLLDRAVGAAVGGNDGIAPIELNSAKDAVKHVAQSRLELARAAAQKEAEIAEVDREVWKLNQSYKGETGAVITTSILAKRECQVEFQLTYRASSFAWLPICSHLTFACSC